MLYNERLGHNIDGQITCRLLNDNLTVVIEDSLTQTERLLLEQRNRPDLVKQMRAVLDSVIRPHVIRLIEEISGRRVLDMMFDTTLDTKRTGMIVVLDDER